MKRVAIIVEGQGEQIFVRNLLHHLLADVQYSFECIKLHADKLSSVPYERNNPEAVIHFAILNVENDDKVLQFIEDNEKSFLSGLYEKIIGLRDMYSREYREDSPDGIRSEITLRFIEERDRIISHMTNPDKISFHHSIMEMETWWLSMHTLIKKIDDRLTVDYIKEHLDFDLENIDPEKSFYHPAKKVEEVLNLVGRTYDKKYGEVESITNNIDSIDIETGTARGRCASFKIFCDDLVSVSTAT